MTFVFEQTASQGMDALWVAKLGIFWLGARAILGGRSTDVAMPDLTKRLPVGSLVALTALVAVGVTKGSGFALWVMSLVFAAFVEEVVFRVLLPRRLAIELSGDLPRRLSVPMVIAMSQGTFALGHFVSPGFTGVGASAVFRLMLAGVALYAVIGQLGFWFAVSLHSLINLSLLWPLPEDFSAWVKLELISLVILVGLATYHRVRKAHARHRKRQSILTRDALSASN